MIAKTHVIVSLLLLLLCGGIVAAVDAAARSRRVAQWIDNRALAKYQAHNRPNVRLHNYGDFFETLMLDELPAADYSRGGSYIFGSSNALFCAEFGDLPPQQAALIHNYSFPGGDPAEILHFIRYLADHEGFLAAGGEKTLVILCLSQDDLLETTPQIVGAGGFFPAYLNGSGFFNYDPKSGITSVPMSAWQRAIKLRRTQLRSFTKRLAKFVEGTRQLRIDVTALRKEAQHLDADDWSSKPSQMAELERLLDYLQSRQVQVVMLIMPSGSWYDGAPFHEGFFAHVPPACAARRISTLDLSHRLADDEFMDLRHPTFEGARKVNKVMVGIALDHLRRTGALPAE